ncbi:HAD hydrolase-like protein, partial [Neisseria gonorrhoeae]|uniref:HAD hydrolase-like protein n=1 Tax=Neisseria gonorrhoeae TaxID=485 RepID=UPI0015D6F070
MTPPKLIIFDWDGTLADTTQPIIDTMRRSFAECGFPPPEAERVRSLIGYSLPEIIRALLEMPSEAAVADIARTYSAHYLNPNNRNMTLFPDAPPCLDKLKAQGFRLAVATGKGRGIGKECHIA